jgi:hypothetical protein
MKETRIDIWDFFTEKVLKTASTDDTTVLWRGQRDPSWPLASSFERKLLRAWGLEGAKALPPYDGHPVDEKEIETIAKRRDRLKMLFARALQGVPDAPRERPADHRLWALGRHFGLTTPFLDWTRNPYFAAFFALAGSALGTQDVAVYRLEYRSDLQAAGLRLHEDIWVPELHRMHRQHGVFTEIDDNFRTFEVEGLCQRTSGREALHRFVIDKRIAKDALADLRAHGLDYHIIYPDLEGAALYANSQVFGD